MIATDKIRMSDLSRSYRIETDLADALTPDHTVEQAVEYYLERMPIPDSRSQRWAAISRGYRLDMKVLLRDLPQADTDWSVLPEVSAGAA